MIGQVVSTARQRARRARVGALACIAAYDAHVAAEMARLAEAEEKRELRRLEVRAERASARRGFRHRPRSRSRSHQPQPVEQPAASELAKQLGTTVQPVVRAEPSQTVQPADYERELERAEELAELIAAQTGEMAQEQPSGWVDVSGEYREPIVSCCGELVDDQAWVVGLLSTDPRTFAPVSDRWSDGWWTEPGALDSRSGRE